MCRSGDTAQSSPQATAFLLKIVAKRNLRKFQNRKCLELLESIRFPRKIRFSRCMLLKDSQITFSTIFKYRGATTRAHRASNAQDFSKQTPEQQEAAVKGLEGRERQCFSPWDVSES